MPEERVQLRGEPLPEMAAPEAEAGREAADAQVAVAEASRAVEQAREVVAEARQEAEAEAPNEREPMRSSPESAETLQHVDRLLRLQGQTTEALHRRVEQIAAEMEAAIAETREMQDEMRGTLELVQREIGRADELVDRVGRATAALTELYDRLALALSRQEAQQQSQQSQR